MATAYCSCDASLDFFDELPTGVIASGNQERLHALNLPEALLLATGRLLFPRLVVHQQLKERRRF